jgi:abequosyltransferase
MDVEICVSDNASKDDTQAVISRYQTSHPIVYYRWPENMGADRNFLKCVEIASGDYCWLMGSDDYVEPGAIRYLIDFLQNHQVVGLSVNRKAYTVDLSRQTWEKPIVNLQQDYVFKSADEAYCYLGMYYGYISGQVIKRSIWNKVIAKENIQKYFNAYVHIFIIGKMLFEGQWAYIKYSCVRWRGDNDSFMSEGRLRRIRIDLYGYEPIVRDLFGNNSRVYKRHLTQVATYPVWYGVLSLKQTATASESAKIFIETLKIYWRLPMYWLKLFPLFLVPGGLLRAIKKLYLFSIKRYRLSKLNSNN